MEASQAGIARFQAEAERWSAKEIVQWALTKFRPNVAVASSFGAESAVLIELAARADIGFRVFTLDTNFLFPETYALIEQIETRYGIQVERTRPALTPEEQAHKHGDALWSREPNLCCQIRKVEPLKLKLAGLQAWITGIRRDQTPARANAHKLEWDVAFGLVKLNPLADWSSSQIWEFIRTHQLPYNRLRDRNFSSIGCTYCTRPVQPGENPRAGRWPSFAKTECGLHTRDAATLDANVFSVDDNHVVIRTPRSIGATHMFDPSAAGGRVE